MKLGILLVKIESRECERFKNGAVVFAIDRIGSQLFGIKAIVRARLVIDDGRVEFFLGSEVSKHHGLRDTRCVCDLFCGCPAETPVREQAYGHREDLRPALFTGHAGTARRLNR